jgi:hypothetical protein
LPSLTVVFTTLPRTDAAQAQRRIRRSTVQRATRDAFPASCFQTLSAP